MGAATFTFNDGLQQQERFPDRDFSGWTRQPKPAKPKPGKTAHHTCPYCEQQLPHPGSNLFLMFGGGFHRLLIATVMIVTAALRCVRFCVASALCLVGLIGSCCRALGERIAHPDDRRLLAAGRMLGRYRSSSAEGAQR